MKKLLFAFPIVALLAAGCNTTEKIQVQPAQSQQPSQQQQTKPADEMANWKTYTNSKYGFEFQYNPKWSISPINTGSGYASSQPYVLVSAGTVSDKPCQDLGCPPKSGDRDELTKGDTYEGSPPLNPWFKILRVRGNQWVLIQITDVNKVCSSEAACQQYLLAAPLSLKTKVSSSDYQTYNDFINLISTFKFTDQTSDWKTFDFLRYGYGFSFKYPVNWVVNEGVNPDKTFSVSAKNPLTGKEDTDVPTSHFFVNNARWSDCKNSPQTQFTFGKAYDTGWHEGFGGAPNRSICVSNPLMTIMMGVAKAGDKNILEKIFSTFKLTK